jgi:ADP-ribose pyrophosphatase YjhB (NUDIX family)
MSYIAPAQVREMMERYGVPRELEVSVELTPAEFSMLRSSRKHERSHDITLFVFRERDYGEFAAIAKPFFPPGVWRAPSGAAHPGEDFETGARREGWEETGLEIEFDRFILLIRARFTCGPEFEDWTSYIFTAFMTGGELEPHDTVEISAVRWLTLDELQSEVREKLRATEMPLFLYRLRLHDESVEEIRKLASGGRG